MVPRYKLLCPVPYSSQCSFRETSELFVPQVFGTVGMVTNIVKALLGIFRQRSCVTQ